MYHSITFGDMNTWDDWHLVPTSRPKFNTPPLKSKKLDIPGGNGELDLSESLTGYPVFGNRTGSFEFLVMNDYKNWVDAYSDICDYLHGRTMKAILEDDPEYCYEGRFTVNEWRSEKNNSVIVIDYDVAPYKLRNERTYSDEIQVTVMNESYIFGRELYGKMPVIPTFISETTGSIGMTMRFVNPYLHIDETVRLQDGESKQTGLICYGSDVEIYFMVEDTLMYLEDSLGNSILDNMGEQIQTKASGRVMISVEQGRL